LTPTLALLNIRLGYWLRNPKWVAKKGGWNRWANFYFIAEMFGKLNEYRRSVYLTDGGHIENLGVRIELPWQQIADMTKATAKAIDEKGNCDKHRGPHVAIGEISYPGDRK